MSDRDVPQAVHAEVDVLLARAAAHGRPLRTVPRLEVDTSRRPRSYHYAARRGRPPVVQVTHQLLTAAPQERA